MPSTRRVGTAVDEANAFSITAAALPAAITSTAAARWSGATMSASSSARRTSRPASTPSMAARMIVGEVLAEPGVSCVSCVVLIDVAGSVQAGRHDDVELPEELAGDLVGVFSGAEAIELGDDFHQRLLDIMDRTFRMNSRCASSRWRFTNSSQ